MRGAGQSIDGVASHQGKIDLKRLLSTVLTWTAPRITSRRTQDAHFQPIVVRRHHPGTGARRFTAASPSRIATLVAIHHSPNDHQPTRAGPRSEVRGALCLLSDAAR